jgi:hypothetical protein
MISNNNNNTGKPSHFPVAAKWFGLINDIIIPLPNRLVPAAVIRAQASIPANETLFRDHDSPEDEIIGEKTEVDLGLGNVFYTDNCGCAAEGRRCEAPAKLAFAVDDRPEVTIRADQTGKTLRELFGVGQTHRLLRDFQSPHDQPITDDESVIFGDGPVFITRVIAEYCIDIEGTIYPWKTDKITVAEIRALGHLPADQSVVAEDGQGQERTLREDEVVHLTECCRVGRAPKYKRG